MLHLNRIIAILLIMNCLPVTAQKNFDAEQLLTEGRAIGAQSLMKAYEDIHKHYIQFAPDSAILFAQRGILEAEGTDNLDFLAQMCEFLTVAYIHIGDYGNAQIFATKGLKTAEELGDLERQSNMSNSMGMIFGAIKDLEKSKEYYLKAIELNIEAGKWLHAGINHGNLSGVYLELNQPEKAKESILESLSAYRIKNDSFLISTALNNLGEFFLVTNQMDSSMFYLNEAITLKRKLQLKKRLPVTLNLLGEAYLMANQRAQARLCFEESLAISEAYKMSLECSAALKGLYEYYKLEGNSAESLKYNERYHQKKDSLFNVEKDKQAKELEMRYQVDKKNNEITLLNSEVLNQKRLRNLGILILVLAAIVFISTYRRIKLNSLLHKKNHELEKERSKQLKFEVGEKNRELMSQSMLSIQRNQILEELKCKLQTLDLDQPTLQQTLKLVEEGNSVEKDWENLKIHFEKVHPEFFSTLQSEFPNLTANDLRHCAYIRIQMSSKDVARIMNIDPKSVKMTRYRLKKKMDLSEEDSLEAFLTNL